MVEGAENKTEHASKPHRTTKRQHNSPNRKSILVYWIADKLETCTSSKSIVKKNSRIQTQNSATTSMSQIHNMMLPMFIVCTLAIEIECTVRVKWKREKNEIIMYFYSHRKIDIDDKHGEMHAHIPMRWDVKQCNAFQQRWRRWFFFLVQIKEEICMSMFKRFVFKIFFLFKHLISAIVVCSLQKKLMLFGQG